MFVRQRDFEMATLARKWFILKERIAQLERTMTAAKLLLPQAIYVDIPPPGDFAAELSLREQQGLTHGRLEDALNRISRLQRQLEEAQQHPAQTAAQMATLHKQVDEARQISVQVPLLQRQLEDARQQIPALQRQVDDLRHQSTQVPLLQRQLDDARQQATQLQRQQDDARLQGDSLNRKSTGNDGSMERIAQLQARLDASSRQQEVVSFYFLLIVKSPHLLLIVF